MAKGRKVSGIFVPIQLDTSLVEQDLYKLKDSFGQTITAMQKGMNNALSSYKLGVGLVNINRALGQIRDGAKALSETRISSFTSSVQGVSSELVKLANTFGGTAKQQENLIKLLANNQAVNQQISALRTLQKELGLTAQESVSLARSLGMSISDKAAISFTGKSDITKQLSAISDEYRRLATLSGTKITSEGFQNFLDTNRIKKAVNAFKELNNGQKVTKEYFEQIARAAGVSQQKVAAYVKEIERASNARRGWSGVFTPSNLSAGIQSGLAAFGVVGGAYGAAELTKSAYQSALKMENIDIAFKSIFESSAAAREQLDFVREVSDKLGLSFVSSAEGAKKLFAAAKGTEVEKDARDIFEAFSTMGTALKLTESEMESVMLAISQMISKGKVSAEELRLQLAERMPGAVNLFAKSIGVTTAELDKMLQNGEVGLDALRSFAQEVRKTYKSGAYEASSGLQAEFNRISTAWFDLKKAFIDTDETAESIRDVSSSLKFLATNADTIKSVTTNILKFSVAVVLASKGQKILSFLYKKIIELSGGAKGIAALTAVIQGLSASLKALSVSTTGYVGAAAALIYGLYELATAESSATKVLNSMKGSVEGYEEALKSATEAQKNFNVESALTKIEKEADVAKTKFNEIFEPKQSYMAGFGPYVPIEESGFDQAIDRLRGIFTGQKTLAILSDAKKLGQNFYLNFSSAFEEYESLKLIDPEKAKKQLDTLKEYTYNTRQAFDILRLNLESAGVSQSDIDLFKEIVDGAVKSTEAIIKVEQDFNDLKKTSSAADFGVDFKSYTSSVKELNEVSKNIKLFSDEDSKKQYESLSNNVIEIVKAINALKDYNSQLEQGANSSNPWSKEVTKGEESLKRFAARVIESNININDFINNLLTKFPEASNEIAYFKRVLESVAQIDLTKSINKYIKDVTSKTALMGKSSYISSLYSILEGAGAVQTGDDLVKIIESGKFELIEFANGAKLSTQQINSLSNALSEADRKQRALTARKESKTLQRNYESVEAVIERITRQITNWDAKTKEFNVDPIKNKVTELKKDIDKALSSGKATSNQITQLKELKINLDAASESYMEYIRTKKKDEATDFYKSIADSYSSITGIIEPDIVKKSSESLYERQLEEAKRFYEADALTRQQYNQIAIMLETQKNDTIRRNSEDLFDQLGVAIDDYYAKYRDFTKGMGDVMTTAVDGISTAIADFATSGMRNVDDLGKAFSSLADSILSMINQLFAQQLVSNLFSGIGKYFGITSDGGSGASGAGTSPGGAAAKGGAFLGSNLSTYSNSVVSSPTTFSFGSKISAFAKGSGLMGEAGPEAVMPLIRTPSGHLGVRAEGTSGVQQNVVINIIDKVGVDVKQQESRDDQGNVRLDLMLEQQMAKSMSRHGSPTNRVLQNVYGARPALASR